MIRFSTLINDGDQHNLHKYLDWSHRGLTTAGRHFGFMVHLLSQKFAGAYKKVGEI